MNQKYPTIDHSAVTIWHSHFYSFPKYLLNSNSFKITHLLNDPLVRIKTVLISSLRLGTRTRFRLCEKSPLC